MDTADVLLHEVRRFAQGIAHATSDQELLQRFTATQSAEAFAELLRRHGPMVLATCRRTLHHLADADDAFQAVFVVLLRKAGTLHRPECLGPWLYRVAWRISTKMRARRRQHVSLPDDLAAHETSDGLSCLDEHLASLPEKYRTPFVLCYLQGLTLAEAAERLGSTTATIATWLHRGRERLRRRLAKQGMMLPSAFLGMLGTTVPSALAERLTTMLTQQTIPAPVARIAGLHGIMGKTIMRTLSVTGACILALGLGVGWFHYHVDGQEPPVTPPAPPDSAPPVEPKTGGLVVTTNFQVRAKSQRIAALIADNAERLRKEKATLWFGKELPTWDKPVQITVRTEKSANRSATTFEFRDFGNSNDHLMGADIDRVTRAFNATMELNGELDVILTDTLQHELMHCLLATYFGKQIPRWADEGIAMMCESDEGRNRYFQQAQPRVLNVPTRNEPYTLEQLLAVKDYPENTALFYTQSYQLCVGLTKRKDRPTLLRFIADGMVNGWPTAAKQHYGFTSLEMMHKELQLALPRSANLAITTLPNSGIFMGLASIEGGTLTIYKLRTDVEPVTQYILKTNTSPLETRTYVPVTRNQFNHIYEPTSYHANNCRATYADGTTLNMEELATALKEPIPLVITRGKIVDRGYASLLQPKTIILVISESAQPVPQSIKPFHIERVK